VEKMIPTMEEIIHTTKNLPSYSSFLHGEKHLDCFDLNSSGICTS
jgi:hypothetical protein